MIVVADASPLNYLIQIQFDTLLHVLFGQVLVPTAVIEELSYSRAPNSVKTWISRRPPWMDVRPVVTPDDDALETLDPGEREAIVLAQQTNADFLLIDERRGRLEARRRGILTTGTLGAFGGNTGIG
jgi:predicted nucleic acid-binding protein